jgi:hypothetical protein
MAGLLKNLSQLLSAYGGIERGIYLSSSAPTGSWGKREAAVRDARIGKTLTTRSCQVRDTEDKNNNKMDHCQYLLKGKGMHHTICCSDSSVMTGYIVAGLFLCLAIPDFPFHTLLSTDPLFSASTCSTYSGADMPLLASTTCAISASSLESPVLVFHA